MSESMPDLPMSDDLHRAVEELIDAALVRDADPHRHRVAVKWMEAEEKVDRLARALAEIPPSAIMDMYRCNICRWVDGNDDSPAHAADCPYLWAVEHLAALEDE